MKILGIDPGTATTGYGVITCEKGKFCVIESGWISTSKDDGKGKRLISTFEQTRSVIQKHRPDIVSIERLFFFINAKTAMTVAESGGVIRLAAALENVPFIEFAPKSIKLEITGYGRADKTMVKSAVRKILNVRSPKKKKTHFDDVSDALAVALCYARKCLLSSDQNSIMYNKVTNGETSLKKIKKGKKEKNKKSPIKGGDKIGRSKSR
ncbi:MAG: Crossover junction endodeoxyribonuclease RuvC [Microgenomates group bacterium ADurb.Bin219]|nr:MAG: Crossover junction endodeoxyribonuclease RuvC [Microgenomates group bacterium ADurb.Bin219]HNP89356.1 crossover junction endodeoxyribonuclease RuvC [Candidatus Woesebacteria bacterium]